jgi:hypothetical protein
MQVAGQCQKGRGWPFVAINSLIRRTLRVECEEETIGRPDDQRVGVNPTVSAIIRWVNRWRRTNRPGSCAWGSGTTATSQPLTNACRKCCQIVPVGRASLRRGSGSFKHAICMALCPAELVVNGLPSAIGSPHNSQHSVELLCWAAVSTAAGTGQLWVGPRRVRHSKPWILVAVSGVIAKPPSLKLHVHWS